MRISLLFLLISILLPNCSRAQNATPDSLKTDSSEAWSFYAGGDYYIIPDEQNILMITAMADRKMLHLEARYNYEDRNTASVWGGLNFTFGNQLELILTPMGGIVFGRTNGLAPGLETTLSYKIFEFSSQSEYVFDFSDKENSFAYTWLQLGASLKNFSLGMAAQRTRAYQTSRDLQRGAYAGYTFHKLTGTFYYFNPFADSYFLVAALSIDF